MATVRTAPPRVETFADLFRAIGEVPLDRIRMHPPPGKATEKDVIAIREGPERRLCELVDGVLVEKAMGTKESFLAVVIIELMGPFVDREDLGIVLGADGMLRLWPGQVRIPDVSFISWERLPNEEVPDAAVAALVPDLAVEVLSRGNTKKEIDRKLRDYFKAGVRLAWVIQPKTQTAEVYTSPTKPRRVGKDQSLDGADVLPGFTLSLKDLFARTKRRRRR